MDAETAYLFRHALVREAAYELQPPTERGSLHRLALDVLEDLVPDAQRDPIAEEFADHAALATVTRNASGRRPSLALADLKEQDADLRRKELRYLTRAVRFHHDNYNLERTLALASRVEAHPLSDSMLRLKAKHTRAKMLKSSGRLSESAALYKECVHHAEELKSEHETVTMRLELADAYRMLSQLDAAEDELLQVQDLPAAQANPSLKGSLLRKLGMLLDTRGDVGRAEAAFREALQLALEHGAQDAIASSHGNLGLSLANRGSNEEALEHLRQAIEVCERSGNTWYLGASNTNMGMLLNQAGRPEQAESYLRRALAIHATTGNARGRTIACYNLANTMLDLQRLDEAEKLFREVMTVAVEVGDASIYAQAQSSVGFIIYRRGDKAAGLAMIQQALDGHRRTGNRRSEGRLLARLGGIQLEAGNHADAETLLRQACTLHEEVEDGTNLPISLFELATLVAQRDTNEARQLAQHAINAAQRYNDPEVLSEAQALLDSLNEAGAGSS